MTTSQPAVRLMTKAEARDAVTQINLSVNKAAALISNLYNREGWRALGYSSWSDCARKEFEYSRSQVNRLLDEAQIREQIKDVPIGTSIAESAIRELKHVPVEKVTSVLEIAIDIAKEKGQETPTAKDVKEAAAPIIQRAKAEAEPVSKESDDKALTRIAKVCGKETRKAIETGTVAMSRKEVEAFASQKDDMMRSIHDLVMLNRWQVSKAVRFISKMPDEKTSVLDLIHLCIANKGTFEATVNGYDIRITKRGRK